MHTLDASVNPEDADPFEFRTFSAPGNAQVSDSRHFRGSAKLEIIPEEGSECQTFFGASL